MSGLGSAVRQGLRATFGSAAAAVSRLRELDQQVRTPLALCRRVGFVAVSGGSGTTTLAATVANLLSVRRSGMVLAVDAAGGMSGLVERTGAVTTIDDPEARQLAATQRMLARTAADARSGLACAATGLLVADLARGGPAVAVATWREAVTPVSRFYDLVVTDWGVRPWAGDLAEVTDADHVLVVVGRADRASAQSAAAVATAVHATTTTRVVLALADVAQVSDRVAAGLRDVLDVPVRTIRNEGSLGKAMALSGRRSAPLRLDLLRLAAAVVDEAAVTLTPRRAPQAAAAEDQAAA